jgi:ATP-dependent Lhr-like helicase
VLRALEEGGRVRRGWFVEGLGAAQFALPGAEDRLRAARDRGPEASDAPLESDTLLLAATDPAQPYGALVPWPARESGARPQRAAGALVLLREGRLLAWIGRSERTVLTFPDEHEPRRTQDLKALARALASLVDESGRRALLVQKLDGGAPSASPLAPYLEAEGFHASHDGLLRRAQPR